TFTVTLSNPQNLSGGAAPALGPPTSATVTIQDNDATGPQDVSGAITVSGAPKANARVTLFTADLAYFREVRSDALGSYAITTVPAGSYRLGVAARGFQYQEIGVTTGGASAAQNFALAAETHPGVWTLNGSIAPELLEGTGSGTLLPTGEVLFCHDTLDPVCIDPVTGVKWFPPTSVTPQGCHIMTLLTRGDAYYGGGSVSGNPQDTVTQVSEYYRRTTNAWTQLANMNLGRWYPGLVRLPDERLLLLGGEVPPNGYNRTNTCEIYNPATNTYTNTGSFNLPSEIPPALLLKNGTVFKTWRYPEFYSITAGTWSAAPNMLQARIGAPTGDHCDHEIVYLPDGRVMAIGIAPAAGVTNPNMVEFFNPATNAWSLGPNVRYQRMRPETVLLPDGRVFAWGGEYTGPAGAGPVLKNAGQVPNCTNTADLFDPATNSWRPVADAKRWVHYHNVQLLLPDGRVMNTGGAGAGSIFGGDSSVEYFSPPYLFRGVRPKIDAVSTTDLVPGGSVTLQVSRTAAVTEVVLLGTRAYSHWVDAGTQRYLSLPFTQNGAQVAATLPGDNVEALAGWYLLMVMVDDIPSEARIVRVTPSAAAPIPSLPTVTIAAAGTPSEAGATGTFTFTRTGGTTAPLAVRLVYGGSAETGEDYAPLAETFTIPAGSATAVLTLMPVNDTLGEGAETVDATLDPHVHYTVGATSIATLAIADKPFDNWRFTKFGADANNPAISGPLADRDGDGIVTLIEFGLDLDPLTPSTSGLPVPGTSNGQLTIALTRNPAATDLRFTVQVSPDLITWTDGSTYAAAGNTPNTAATTDITPNDSPAGYTLVVDNAPASATPRFIRVQIAPL
ncbi:MAG: galactose oxidase-like domain-containing protein, partial [Verrucomicrobiales bacterium]